MKPRKANFEQFLAVFPEVDLPVTLNEESLLVFSRTNAPLTLPMIAEYINAGDPAELSDGMTEYVPCLRIPETQSFQAIIYWRGGLMNSQFVLTTFAPDGTPIASAVIGGLESDGKVLLKSIATIDENWMVHIVEGQQPVQQVHYAPESTRAFQMKLQNDGEVLFLIDDGMERE